MEEVTHIPALTIKFYLVNYGYQVDVFVDGEPHSSECRDYSGAAACRTSHLRVIMAELSTMLTRVRDTFDDRLDVGDVVKVPSWAKTGGKRERINIITGIYPESGREYMTMTKVLKSGKPSQDKQAVIYWQLAQAHKLEKVK